MIAWAKDDERRPPRLLGGTPSDDDAAARRRQRVSITAVLAAVVLAVLDTAIVNVALPTMSHALQVDPGDAVWIVTAYQAALVMGLLPCAALGESLGYRRVFVIGVVLFSVASLLCALSPDLPSLIAARFLQGLGASAIMALGMALMRLVISQERLGALIGWNALTVALSSAAGPSIGAAILSVASWPWLFALNLPFGAAVVVAARALPDAPGTGRPLDWVSVALNVTTFGVGVAGVELLTTHMTWGLVLLTAGMATLVALTRRELHKQAPLIPLDLLRDPSFRTSVLASIACFTGVTASLLSLPFFLQHELGRSTFETGLYMTAWPLTVALVAPLAGYLADRWATAGLCAIGGVCLAVGLGLTAAWPPGANPVLIVPLTMLCGLGFGLFQVSNNRNMFLSTLRERSAAAGGLQATARLSGQTSGGVAMSLLFAALSTAAVPKIGLAIGAALTLLAGLISLWRSPR